MLRVRGVSLTARLPWDVPVRLIPIDPSVTSAATTTADPQLRRVDLGLTLPGVVAVDVVTVPTPDGGPSLLTDVRPVGDLRHGPRVDGTLAELLEGLHDGAAVTVAVAGTAFTQDVLAALARVPTGARCTYAGLAADAGRPRAVRAVASVMARNRVPLVLPCHRVVPSGGGTGRYAWGDAVKVALLDAESRVTERGS